MCVLAAREIKDSDVVFVGIGLPNLACNLARNTHAPNMTLIYESGAVGAQPDRVPPSIGDPGPGHGLPHGLLDGRRLPVLPAERQDPSRLPGRRPGRQARQHQHDRGRPVRAPKVRLPGSGGACEIALHAQRVLIVTKLDKRAFPEKVDFITSTGKRVKKVITNMGTLEPDPAGSGELLLASLYPGVTFDEVQANVGWRLRALGTLKTVDLPTSAELSLLRDKLDPQRRYIK